MQNHSRAPSADPAPLRRNFMSVIQGKKEEKGPALVLVGMVQVGMANVSIYK